MRLAVVALATSFVVTAPVLGDTNAHASRPDTSVRRTVVALTMSDEDNTPARGRGPGKTAEPHAHGHDHADIDRPAMSEPLDVGDAVMVGASWAGDALMEVRTRDDGEWSPWTSLHRDRDHHVPDPESPEHESIALDVSEPVWTGHVDDVQFRGTQETDLDVTLVDSAGGQGLDWAPGDRSPGAADAGTVVRRRDEWGADESLRDGRVGYSSSGTVRFSVVHHIGGNRTWTWDEIQNGCRKADDIIRGIYEYHTTGRGYWDIAYNFVVDPCGTIWEARAGGITKPVNGAHAGGFNDGSVGVLALGTFSGSNPDPVTGAMREGIEELIGSKLRLDNVAPGGRTRETSGGGSARWPEGASVYLPVLSAHQISNSTTCPGNALMSRLFDGEFADASPTSAYVSGVRDQMKRAGWPVAVRGDWLGAGRPYVLLYDPRDGQAVVRRLSRIGHVGDIVTRFVLAPGWSDIVVGDWDGDGDDELTFHRASDGTMVTYSGHSSGWIGTPLRRQQVHRGWTDLVAGDWDSDGRDQLLFHRRKDGRFASFDVAPEGTLQGRTTVTNVVPGWDQIISADWSGNSRDGLTFYRRSDGRYSSFTVDPDGSLDSRTLVRHVSPGWTAIVAEDWDRDGFDEQSFYRRSSGVVASYEVESTGQLARRTHRIRVL